MRANDHSPLRCGMRNAECGRTQGRAPTNMNANTGENIVSPLQTQNTEYKIRVGITGVDKKRGWGYIIICHGAVGIDFLPISCYDYYVVKDQNHNKKGGDFIHSPEVGIETIITISGFFGAISLLLYVVIK